MYYFVAVEALNCANISSAFICVFVSRLWCSVILWFPVAVVGSSFVPRFLVIILIVVIASGVVLTITFKVILSIALVVI